MSGGGGVQSRECEESGHIASAALLVIDSIAGDPCDFRHEQRRWPAVEDEALRWGCPAAVAPGDARVAVDRGAIPNASGMVTADIRARRSTLFGLSDKAMGEAAMNDERLSMSSGSFGVIAGFARAAGIVGHGTSKLRVSRPRKIILSAMLMITGCENGSPEQSKGKNVPESAPFEPQECPKIDLADLRLPDGTIANVRILKIGDTLLYVPVDWLMASSQLARAKNVGGVRSNSGQSSNTKSEVGFEPEIVEVECPGVVHQAPKNMGGYNEIRLFFRRADSGSYSTSSISPSSFVQGVYLTNEGPGTGATAHGMAQDENWTSVLRKRDAVVPNDDGWHRIGSNTFVDNSSNFDDLNRWFLVQTRYSVGGGSASQWVLPEIMLRYDAPIDERHLPKWRALRKPMRELGAWLATPPSRRDNQKIFQLGERQ